MEINQVKLGADRKFDQGHMEDMLAKTDTNQEKADAIHKEMIVKINDNQKRMEADRKTDREEMKQEIIADQKHVQEMIRTSQEKMEAALQSMRSDLDETIRQRVENVMTHVNHETEDHQKKLTERSEKTQVKLQAVGACLDTQARKFQDIRADFITNLAMVDLGVEASNRETLTQQRIMEEKIEANKCEFRAQLEEVKAVAERGSRPAVCASAAQPPAFNRNMSWSMFPLQFETVAEHSRFLDQDKSTYCTTAWKGRAADVLHGIPTNTTYEETLQTLEDRFGDQHFAAVYRCQLTRTQKAGESLQDFAMVIERLAHSAYPTVSEDHIWREAGKAFAYGVEDPDIRIYLLLGGEKMINEAL
jgi:hypothetical protein